MYEYVVQSGPLKITIVADCPRSAAAEAVACWEGRQGNAASRPAMIEPELSVRRGGQRVLRHFSAVRIGLSPSSGIVGGTAMHLNAVKPSATAFPARSAKRFASSAAVS